MQSYRIDRLRDLATVRCAIEVEHPVLTPTGPKTIDGDDDVELVIRLPGNVSVQATIRADAYMRIAEAMATDDQLALALPEPG